MELKLDKIFNIIKLHLDEIAEMNKKIDYLLLNLELVSNEVLENLLFM